MEVAVFTGEVTNKETTKLSDVENEVVTEVEENYKAEVKPGSVSDEDVKIIADGSLESMACPIKNESHAKTDSSKRKRSTEGPVTNQERVDIQRRSTRSRACAQRIEEDIFSLRAELRSFLPTALLYVTIFCSYAKGSTWQ